MRVGQKHAQRRRACHKRRRARAGAEGGAVGAPSARRVGGASWQPFPREPNTQRESEKRVKKRVTQHQKRAKGLLTSSPSSVNETLNPFLVV